jgi:hypothetical protein
MGMGRPSPYGQQGSFFGGGFSPMFSPMMQSPMYGGPGKGRYPMQPQRRRDEARHWPGK